MKRHAHFWSLNALKGVGGPRHNPWEPSTQFLLCRACRDIVCLAVGAGWVPFLFHATIFSTGLGVLMLRRMRVEILVSENVLREGVY